MCLARTSATPGPSAPSVVCAHSFPGVAYEAWLPVRVSLGNSNSAVGSVARAATACGSTCTPFCVTATSSSHINAFEATFTGTRGSRCVKADPPVGDFAKAASAPNAPSVVAALRGCGGTLVSICMAPSSLAQTTWEAPLRTPLPRCSAVSRRCHSAFPSHFECKKSCPRHKFESVQPGRGARAASRANLKRDQRCDVLQRRQRQPVVHRAREVNFDEVGRHVGGGRGICARLTAATRVVSQTSGTGHHTARASNAHARCPTSRQRTVGAPVAPLPHEGCPVAPPQTGGS